jgi:hypothetical protein
MLNLTREPKPHLPEFESWFVLAVIGFSVQVMGFTAFATLIIFLMALKNGKKDIARADWVSLALAGVALFLWFFTKIRS